MAILAACCCLASTARAEEPGVALTDDELFDSILSSTSDPSFPTRITPSSAARPPAAPRSGVCRDARGSMGYEYPTQSNSNSAGSTTPPPGASPFGQAPGGQGSLYANRFASVPNIVGDLFGGGSGTRTPVGIIYTGIPLPSNLQVRTGVLPQNTFTLAGTDPDGSPVSVTGFATAMGALPVPVVLSSQDSAATIRTNLEGSGAATSFNLRPVRLEDQAALNDVNNQIFLDEDFGPLGTVVGGQTIFPLVNGGTATRTDAAGDPVVFNPNGGVAADATPFNTQITTFYQPQLLLFLPNLENVLPNGLGGAPTAAVGRIKLAENTSPLPRDRVYVNYSYFNNTPLLDDQGVDVSRVTPGVERTFFDGRFSIEVRTPFATTLSSDVNQVGAQNTARTEFGNVTTYLKGLAFVGETFAISTGFGVSAPTADDFKVRDATGASILQVNNDSVRILPFVGGVYAPNERFFSQGTLQFDVDTNGNPVSVTTLTPGGAVTGDLMRVARARDATWMFIDMNVGYWVYQNPDSDNWITGVAPVAELHYNQTLEQSEGVSGTVVVPEGPNITLLNGTVGVTTYIRDQASLTLAYGTPLAGGNDKQFDGELRVLFNWYYGSALNRLTRPQF